MPRLAAARRAAYPTAAPGHGLGTRVRPDPRHRQRAHTVWLIGPGSGFDLGYAMTSSPDDPVIIATLTIAGGEPAGPLLTGGCRRLYKAAVTGAGLPALVLTAAETLSIRHPVTPR